MRAVEKEHAGAPKSAMLKPPRRKTKRKQCPALTAGGSGSDTTQITASALAKK